MSNDEAICTNLIQTLEDGANGFATAASRLADDGRPDVAATFAEMAQQRAEMATELQQIAAMYGDDIARRGTVAAAVHRGWMGLKDAVAGNDAGAVFSSAERGERHAMEQYSEAMEADISPEFRTVLARQKSAVEQSYEYVRSLDAVS